MLASWDQPTIHYACWLRSAYNPLCLLVEISLPSIMLAGWDQDIISVCWTTAVFFLCWFLLVLSTCICLKFHWVHFLSSACQNCFCLLQNITGFMYLVMQWVLWPKIYVLMKSNLKKKPFFLLFLFLILLEVVLDFYVKFVNISWEKYIWLSKRWCSRNSVLNSLKLCKIHHLKQSLLFVACNISIN